MFARSCRDGSSVHMSPEVVGFGIVLYSEPQYYYDYPRLVAKPPYASTGIDMHACAPVYLVVMHGAYPCPNPEGLASYLSRDRLSEAICERMCLQT